MKFNESVTYLYRLGNDVEAMKLGLENIGRLLSALGQPQCEYFKIQVAGTNGKGSTVAFLESICLAAGLKCGATMSPHLVSITERVRIGGKDIDENEFAQYATLIRATSERLVANGVLETVPTYFEQVTAIALKAFADHGVEIAILETGLGGRFDAMTAARAEVAVITPINLDHQRILGETIAEIAFEKASIIGKHTKLVVSTVQNSDDATAEIEKKCADANLRPIFAHGKRRTSEPGKIGFSTAAAVYDDVSIALAGEHQTANAVLAVTVAERLTDFGFDVSRAAIIKGLRNARHYGRLEYCSGVLLDGAHNPAGATALRDYLRTVQFSRLTFVFGAMEDKKLNEVTAILFPLADRIILTRADNSRSAATAAIIAAMPESFDLTKVTEADDVGIALSMAADSSVEGELVCVTGSLYLVGEARRILTEKARAM